MKTIIRMNRVVFVLTFALFSFLLAINSSGENGGGKWTVPEFAKKLKNPVKADIKSITAGKEIYNVQCATCHGESGIGNGQSGRFLEVKPADLTAPEIQNQTDGEIFWKISGGRAPMPAFKDILTSEQRWQVLNYMRTLKK